MEFTFPGIGIALFQILCGLFVADFLTGLIHWIEDRYGNPQWPMVGEAIRANHQHHSRPREFLSGSFWSRNKEVLIGTFVISGIFALVGALNLITVSAVVTGFFANEIHGAAHKFPHENPVWVRVLQKLGLMQSFQHHARHHRQRKDCHYCVMTNYVNPIVDFIRFFPILEWAIYRMSGILPRVDPTVRRNLA